MPPTLGRVILHADEHEHVVRLVTQLFDDTERLLYLARTRAVSGEGLLAQATTVDERAFLVYQHLAHRCNVGDQ